MKKFADDPRVMEHIRRLWDAAPPLAPEQADELHTLWHGPVSAAPLLPSREARR